MALAINSYFIRDYTEDKENPKTEIFYDFDKLLEKIDEAKEKDLKISVFKAECVLDWS